MTFLWSYTEALAGGDVGWWRAATRHAADLLEADHWWLDPPALVPVQHLLVETTALLSYALARSVDGDPGAVTGAQLGGWAAARPLPLLDETVPDSLEGSLSLLQWSRIFEEQRLRQQNDFARLLVAAGHRLPATGDPVADLWQDLVDRENSGRRYGLAGRLPGPALALGLGAVRQQFVSAGGAAGGR
ncbi:hypothetical protein ACWT_1933 [Actinoplanes sp. SE50]|uniref:hypothetical protein n=1 Tax=unclassified Actinoplanes TaxID=2626549 RepID=UPI00023EC066|nr:MULTISPECIES: hypothetical protein [unclassified Actinoplanes]AEV82952.1 hypothetical protein ACPL_2055 [Actinoplanes sp. SE50/110]ATO81348.1 hypothetical protein ACWT_1933 [Actinoplanes sp. SE50]SLL98755.1 hypothetical protein ACSP50_1982 [Actinoplanes sp. SE50/110]